MTRAEALPIVRGILRRPGVGRPLRRLACVYGDSVLELDIHPSPLATRRERRLRALLARSLGGES